MKLLNYLFVLTMIVLIQSCNSKNNEYDPYKISGGTVKKKEASKTAFEVEFKRTEANLKTIHINLNGSNSYDAIFDTGCSGVSISIQEANDMVKQGKLSLSDRIGRGRAQIADGSVIEQDVFNLKEVSVTDKNGNVHTLRDIQATVGANPWAAILIGTSVIDNLARKSYTVDLKKNVIRFE